MNLVHTDSHPNYWALFFSWLGWLMSHILEANEVLQTCALLFSIAASLIVIVKNLKKTHGR